MPIPPALAAALAALTAAVDDDATDIAGSVDALSSALAAAVDSYLGLSVEMDSFGHKVDFTVLTEVDALSRARTSLRLSALPGSGSDAPSAIRMVFYAATPGAFVDLAADAAWLIGSSAHATLDGDLSRTGEVTRPDTLGELSTVNQAIGVLIGRGHTIESARVELVRMAAAAGTTLSMAAAVVMADLD